MNGQDLIGNNSTNNETEKITLCNIFMMQNALKRDYQEVGNCPNLHEAAMEFIVDLGKAMNCLKNKPWKQTMVLTDIPKFKNLLIQSFFSFIFILVTAGLTEDDLINLYFRKSEVNAFRQRSKY